MTSLSASLGISAPESAGRAPRSWGLAGSDENWTGPSFYNVPRALDVIQREKKVPKTTLSWSCFVSAAIVVLKSLCGQDVGKRQEETLSSKVTRCPFKASGF